MKAFWNIFCLELVALWRTGTLAILAVASVAWMAVAPWVIRGDGTAEGAHELIVRFSLGGVFALLVVALLGTATGVLAKERAARRLQLTMVRPVRSVAIALGKTAALAAAGAAVLALAAATLALRTDLSARCSHVLSPQLPSPREEAEIMYADYMRDPRTPEAVRRTKKPIVLRLLAQRALDHYQTIATNGVAHWTFGGLADAEGLAVRLRFTNQYEMRQDVVGRFRLGPLSAAVSNVTQAVLTVPLAGGAGAPVGPTAVLSFANGGKSALMLRPRKDIHLLAPADGFAANLVRAYLVMLSVLTLVIAFGTFLSAALGRPVALFTAIVALALSEMSPSVVEQYPDALETDRLDRLGLVIARATAEATHPISSLSPLTALSKNECVEWRTVRRALFANLVLAPLLLSLLAAFVLPRKQDDL